MHASTRGSSSSRGRKRSRGAADDEDAKCLTASDLEEYNCAICRDVQHEPAQLACSHVFCMPCIKAHIQASDDPKCPVCRQEVSEPPKRADTSDRLHKKYLCACGDEITLLKLRRHMDACAAYAKAAMPPAVTPLTCLPVAPAPAPNRSTFACPFCDAKHLPRMALLAHLTDTHGEGAMRPAVCPVCAAMPWGDSNYVSPNLLMHMQHRHRFDYDTTADFNQDEDAVLQEVLRRSQEEQ